MKYTCVMPWVDPVWRDACLATCKIDVLSVDNSVINQGVPRAWNQGIDQMYRDETDWLILMSTAIRFGEPGGLDFIQLLLDRPDHRAISALHTFGWHLIAFSRETIDNVGRFDENFCVDDQTEALTKRGWLRCDQITTDDSVLTLSAESGCAEWQPVLRVNRWDVTEHPMILMDNQAHSSLTTLDHRWLVERFHQFGTKRGGTRTREFVTSESMQTRDRIPCSAPLANGPTAPGWSDDFVELAAWYWTEGHNIVGTETGVSLSQSESANPGNVLRIRGLLSRLFGAPVSSLREPAVSMRAAWRESWSSRGIVSFSLNALGARELKLVVEGQEKVLTGAFLSSLTQTQLHLLIQVSIMADGNVEKNGFAPRRRIGQASKARLDAFQMACSLAGINSVMSSRATVRGRFSFWNLALLPNRPFTGPVNTASAATSMGSLRALVERRSYTGRIWCPTTANGTWFARRRGTVYFTGNSPAYYEDIDWAIRMYRVKPDAPWGAYAIDVQDAGMAHSIDGGFVTLHNKTLLAYFRDKWGAPPGSEWVDYYMHPFNKPTNPASYWPPPREVFPE